MALGESSWDDICAMGNNLWQLLFQPIPRPLSQRRASNHNALLKSPLSLNAFSADQVMDINNFLIDPRLGRFSHGTISGYAIIGPGSEYVRNWKYLSPVKVIEKVKAMLLSERTGAEWEILEGNEWEDATNDASVDTEQRETTIHRPAIDETGVLVKPSTSISEGDCAWHESREKGTSGWTKLKNR